MVSLLNEVVSDLEQHENALRIRKLIYCAARNQWENDRNALSALSLRDLVQELLDLNTTLDQLSISLYEIVKNLNRQTEYSLVANTIISYVGKLYSDGEDCTQVVAFKPQKRDTLIQSSVPVRSLAQKLEEHPDSVRLRKLLFCICENQWVNDIDTVVSVDLEELVKQAYQLHPTLDALSLALQNIVDSLNRKAEYSSLSNVIIAQFGQLYQDSEDSGTHSTQPLNSKVEQKARPSQGKQPEQFPPTKPLEIDDSGSATPSQQSLDKLSSRLAQQANTYDPFSVRLEVMKFSNPLRAKILAFSILHHQFDYKGKDWSSLRTSELDELLLEVYQKCPTLSELESQLGDLAQNLDDRDESLQAASAIARAMKPFYRSI